MTDRAAVLTGLGVNVPPHVLTNDDLAERMDTSDEWIRARTGIRERRVADDDTATADLAVEAGLRALKSAGGTGVDAVIVATTTPDRICPSTAPEVASRLDQTGVMAFDIGAVCSGFVYGLAAGAGLIAAGTVDRVLVIGAEVMFRFMAPADRSTAVIFGDGAGAVVLRAGRSDELGAFGPFDLGADGGGSDLIRVDAGGSRLPASRDGIPADAHFLHMDGREVYRHAVARMVASSRTVLERVGWTVDDVDRLVAHQANSRIIDAVGDRLGLPAAKRFLNVDRYGNTSAASIPLALADAGLSPGDRVLLSAFGGGLTWGSTVLTWPDITVG
ncbi:MAG: ketoacyl-ACP synthase III [Euzebyaceae bacterium]|jgi:3-oxoacyl-[acyl-carrier-protein] synthase-3|nr:ketoacyl-ACP synthase III [Euzebyaceae bacterium]